MTAFDRPRRLQRIALHLVRFLLFVSIIVLIHIQHARISARPENNPTAMLDVNQLRKLFPAADSVSDSADARSGHEVFDKSGRALGHALQTSPFSDHLIGFSGPTNTLIAFSTDDRIIGIDILSSGDTRDHVKRVRQSAEFLKSFNNLTWDEASKPNHVDTVSGATLTSLAIRESIIYRLSGGRPSLRFSDPLTANEARHLFPSATSVKQDAVHSALWHVTGGQGKDVGSILRTSPHADNIIGYQGPTETLIGFGTNGRVIGISLGKSYDNEKYVTYVRDDEYFLTLFNNLVLDELSRLEPKEAEIEGVSGATMTSMAVVKGLLLAAEEHHHASVAPDEGRQNTVSWTLRDFGTAIVIVLGLTIALTSLRGNKTLRTCFQLVVIGYLGLINGDMLSQAMIVGWAQNGVPWRNAGGLVLLTVAAFLVPLTTRRNAYCTHLCPHGAAQHLLRNRLPWRLHLPHWLARTLKSFPAMLVAWCVTVGIASLSFSLVDIEPFDAWVFRVAGWATLTIAVAGLVASLFIPMAYCRYGCPTGAVLNFLRFNARSDRWSLRDSGVVILVLLSAAFVFAS